MAVEYGIVTSIMPPRGWHYPQVLSSGQSVELKGFTFEMLLENMLEFRRRHPELCGGSGSATIESVRSDLKHYLCSHFKQNCADSHASPMIGIGVTKSVSYARPIDKAGDWLAKVAQSRLDFVEPAEAARRAQICAACPQNIKWQTGCAPCNDNISVRVQNLRGSRATPYDRHLFVCRVFGHLNEAAVWLADTQSSSDQLPPSVCWKQ